MMAILGCRLDGDVLEPQHPSALGSMAGIAEPSSRPANASSASIERGPRLELAALSRAGLWATWNSLRGDAYALDDVERSLDAPLDCHPEALVTHPGGVLRYQGAVQVDPAFRERLLRFEQLVVDVAIEIYGRAPSGLRHFGTYSCRPTRRHAGRLSEHALGNAIDVLGFDFARAKRGEPLAPGVPSTLARAFQVRVARHWAPRETSSAAATHARFLHALAERLGDRSDVFRGMIGPSRRDHADHFHFDMSPWRYVWF